MYARFGSHDAKISTSSARLVDYLSKENQGKGYFFSNDYNLVNQKYYDADTVKKNIDDNRGIRNIKDSNYYQLDISPSKNELEHIEKLVVVELSERGLNYKDAVKNKDIMLFYQDQKDELTNHYLKLYAQDVMKSYASNFKAQVYTDINNLPSRKDTLEINKEVRDQLNNFITARKLKSNLLEIDTPKFQLEEGTKEDFKVDNGKESKDYYEYTYKGYKLFANKNIARLNNNILSIDPKRLEHYLSNAIKKEALRGNIINLKDYDSNVKVNTFKSKGKEITLYEMEYKPKNLDPITLKFNSDKVQLDKGKINIKYGDFMDAANGKINDKIAEIVESFKEECKDKIWKEKGFCTEKRDLIDKDLMYYATIENNRTYKRTNTLDLKSIDFNNKLKKEIDRCIANGELGSADNLKKGYLRDKYTNEVIFEGTKKGGNNKHIHIIVSRHDAYNKDPRHKVSLSPNTNHRNGNSKEIIKRGFNRSEFFQDIETAFDKKFDYSREWDQSYAHRNKTLQEEKTQEASTSVKGYVKGYAKGKLKQEIYKITGYQEVKNQISPKKHLNEINPIKQIKKEMKGLPLPTSLPKSKVDLAVKFIKAIISQTQQSIQY